MKSELQLSVSTSIPLCGIILKVDANEMKEYSRGEQQDILV
jgi:hypothetical protein